MRGGGGQFGIFVIAPPLPSVPQNFGGISADYGVRRHVFCYHGVRRDDTAVVQRDPGHNRRPVADPDVILDNNGAFSA